MQYPKEWKEHVKKKEQDVSRWQKVSHRKPKGYRYVTNFQLKSLALSMADSLDALGYDTKILEEDGVYYLYKKMR